MRQDKVSRLSDVENSTDNESSTSSKNIKPVYKPSYGERWNKTRPTKMIVFLIFVATIVLTIIIGFSWGGWTTGATANKMTNEAVTQRLALICVGQFNQDPDHSQKLTELQETNPFGRDDYVKDQGWATMPGEDKPDSKVADGCAKLIVRNGQ